MQWYDIASESSEMKWYTYAEHMDMKEVVTLATITV